MEEGEIIVNRRAALRRSNDYNFSDFSILYRTNAQSRIFEEALRKRGLPYKIYGGLSFYQRKEIKDVIAYFRLVVNPNDEEAFKRIINYPARGIGDTTLNKIIFAANSNEVSLWKVINEPLTYGLEINKGTHAKLQVFRELIESFIDEANRMNAYDLGVDIVRRSGIINEICQDNTPENISRKENIEELVSGLNDFCLQRQEEGNQNLFLNDFLSEVSLLTDQDSDKEGDGEKITLMTIHSSKGLEFKNVFVVGLEENLFPSNMSGDSQRAMEEERRLFYVAITRAEDNCFLSFAKMRFKYGKMEFATPSRFLNDIDPGLIKLPSDSSVRSSSKRNNSERRNEHQLNSPAVTRIQREKLTPLTKEPIANSEVTEKVTNKTTSQMNVYNIIEGQKVIHERFGKGEVLKIDGMGDNAKASIQFENVGIKQLLLRFARLKVID